MYGISQKSLKLIRFLVHHRMRFMVTSLKYRLPRFITDKSLLHCQCTKKHFAHSNSHLQDSEPIKTNEVEHSSSMVAEDEMLINAMRNTFPLPRHTLKNFEYLTIQNLKKDFRCSYDFTRSGPDHCPVFVCTLRFIGELSNEFQGYGSNKRAAESAACLKALSYLYEGKRMDYIGRPSELTKVAQKHPVVKSKLLKLFQKEIPLSLPENILSQIETLIFQFETEIVPIISETKDGHEDLKEEEAEPSWLDLMTGKRRFGSPASVDAKNDELVHRALFLKNNRRWSYPIDSSREDILASIKDNPVTIIEGGTGCGKSTQVPNMVLDEWSMAGKGSECNIVVSQPRRIATLSLANYVTYERRETLGKSVGYKMRLEDRYLRERGGVMFYTTGSLREMFRRNPSLSGVSHVIIDEVHERSLDTDLLLLLAKWALSHSHDLKLILMSATARIGDLSSYFNTNSIIQLENENPYPVKPYHLDEVVDLVYKESSMQRVKVLEETKLQRRVLKINHDFVCDVVEFIDENKPEGAILVFLPGWNEIKQIQKRLEPNVNLRVLPLHSRLTKEVQRKIFSKSKEGQRKVILSTNIAETSLTINDVVYVVDPGLQNDFRFDPERNASTFGVFRITRANAIQRMGRAGRVRPGEVYRLYDATAYEKMDEFPLPEVLKLSLETLLLRCKFLFEETSVRSLLQEFIATPSPLAVEVAIQTLSHLRILRQEDENTESLTSLGRAAANISSSPTLNKSLVYSAFFSCCEPVTNYVALENKTTEIFKTPLTNSQFRELKFSLCQQSDLVAMCRFLYHILRQQEREHSFGVVFDDDDPHQDEWEREANQTHPNYEDNFPRVLDMICPQRLFNFIQLKNLLRKQVGHLFPCGLSETSNEQYTADSAEDSEWEDWEKEDEPLTMSESHLVTAHTEMVIASFLSSATSIIRRVKLEGKSSPLLISEDNRKISIHKSSVFSDQNLNDLKNEFFFSTDMHHSQGNNMWVAKNLSSVSPAAIALFYGRKLEILTSESEDGLSEYILGIEGRNIRFQTDKRTANCLIGLRKVGEELLDFYLESYSNSVTATGQYLERERPDETVVDFKNKYIQLVQQIL